jgi:endonuclease G
MRTRSAALAGAVLAAAGALPVPPAHADPIPPPVVGGERAAPGAWADAAVVFEGDTAACTGTLIAPNLVVTAGHCIGRVSGVRLDAVELQTEEGETIPVAQQIEYPDSTTTYDVGLLVLERPSTIRPRVLATGCVLDRYLRAEAPVEIVGWGAVDVEGSQYPDVLMQARSTVTDPDCTTAGLGCRQVISPGGELGAGGDGIDSCFGDSGGPLYLLTDIGEYLVGITSRGYDDFDPEQPCGGGGIYVRPDAILDWIEETGGVSLPRATCNARPEPTADPDELEVVSGGTVRAVVAANDPDDGDSHTFSLAVEPKHGQATVAADGAVTYTASASYDGDDQFTVEVADSGVPSLAAAVEFEVDVLPSDGCGCRASGPGAGGAGAIALAALAGLFARPGRARRRRRARPR